MSWQTEKPKTKQIEVSIWIWAHYQDAIVWHMSSKPVSKQKMTVKRLEVLFWPEWRNEQTIFRSRQPFCGISGTFPAIFRHILKKCNNNSCNISFLGVSQLQEKMTYSNDSSNAENLHEIAFNMCVLLEMTLFDLWPLCFVRKNFSISFKPVWIDRSLQYE